MHVGENAYGLAGSNPAAGTTAPVRDHQGRTFFMTRHDRRPTAMKPLSPAVEPRATPLVRASGGAAIIGFRKETRMDSKGRVTFTLRIPERKSDQLRELASDVGMSQNDLILYFISVGMRSHNELIRRYPSEFRRFLSQNP